MVTPERYEEQFHIYMANLPFCAPDGIIGIDLAFLHSIGLLRCRESKSDMSTNLTDYFHVVESWEKITLFNQKFVVWIVPRVVEGVPSTFIIITLIQEEKLNLEIVFSTSGIYNAPRLILRILEHFLDDIEENETIIAQIEQ